MRWPHLSVQLNCPTYELSTGRTKGGFHREGLDDKFPTRSFFSVGAFARVHRISLVACARPPLDTMTSKAGETRQKLHENPDQCSDPDDGESCAGGDDGNRPPLDQAGKYRFHIHGVSVSRRHKFRPSSRSMPQTGVVVGVPLRLSKRPPR